QSSPYGRASNGDFNITVTNLELRLPTLEPPDGGMILAPSPPVIPGGDEPGTCATGPVPGCRAPAVAHKALLRLSPGRLLWKWTRGAATTVADFGNPLASTSYSLCIYGGSQLLMTATASGSDSCGGKPCWTARSTGFRYTDSLLTPTGVSRLDLKAGPAGKAKIGMKGKGPLLAVPTLDRKS